MARLSVNAPVGESSYGSAGPGYRVEARVQAVATEYYMGQILVADSGLVKLVGGTSAASFDAAPAIFGICVERHTAALNSSDHKTVERDARYWIYNETLAVDVIVDKILYAGSDNMEDLYTNKAEGPVFGRIVMVEDGVRMLVDTSRGAVAVPDVTS